MAARDTLSEGIVSLEAHLASADKDAQAAAMQVSSSFRRQEIEETNVNFKLMQ